LGVNPGFAQFFPRNFIINDFERIGAGIYHLISL
jgi:hypothetical protein